MAPDSLISLDAIYQHIEDSYALDGKEAKALIESFVETSEAWLEAYDRSPREWPQIAEHLIGDAAGIGFDEFLSAAQRFQIAVIADDSETREEAYRMMVVLLGRLKNEFNA
jgi:hypothetical protein